MKQVLPGGATKVAERLYHKGRAKVVAARYGNPGYSLKVLVVMGTNGKTTTARYLEEMLQEAGQTTALLLAGGDEALNVSRVQTFLQTTKKAGVRNAIITLESDDIRRHSLGATPIETAIVTSVSDTTNETTAEQCELIASVLATEPRYIVLNRDDASYEALSSYVATAQKITYGRHEEAESHLTDIKLYKKGSELQLVVDHQTELPLATHLVGEANAYNLAAAATTLYVMGESLGGMDEGAARLEAVPGNYEYLRIDARYDVVLDRAPNEAALREVMYSAKQLTKQRLLAVVQANITSDECLDELSKLTARLLVIDVNDRKRDKGSIERIVSSDAAIKQALRAARSGDTVLLAGPLFARLETDGTSYAQTTLTNFMQD